MSGTKAKLRVQADWLIEIKEWISKQLYGHFERITADPNSVFACDDFPVIYIQKVDGKSTNGCMCPAPTEPGEITILIEIITRGCDSELATQMGDHLWFEFEGICHQKLHNYNVQMVVPNKVAAEHATLVVKEFGSDEVDFYTQAMTITITAV